MPPRPRPPHGAALGRPSVRARRRCPRRGRAQPALGARRGDRGRSPDRWRRPARRGPCVAAPPTPPGRSPTAPADGETAPCRRSRAGLRPRRRRSLGARPLAVWPPPTRVPGRRQGQPRRPQQPMCVRGKLRQPARKLSSIRRESAIAPGKPNPPASCAGVNPRGNSNNASGFPRVSATIRSCTRSSNGTPRPRRTTRAHHHHAGPRRRAPEIPAAPRRGRASPTPARSAPPTAAEPRTPAPAPKPDQATARHRRHRASGCSSAISANRLSTANPTRNRSGACPARSPNATPSASP